MITPQLEKAILNGWASYKRVAHAFGSFGGIPVPDDSVLIITDIKWFPFLDPINYADTVKTWADFFKFNEYQLKIESKTSKNYLQFRNKFRWKWFPDGNSGLPAGTSLNNIVDPGIVDKFLLPEESEPIIENVFFVCNEYIKLSITRNVFIKGIAEIQGFPQPRANENNAPDGLANTNVLLRAQMFSMSGANFYYYAPSIPYAGNNVPTANRRNESYKQDIDPTLSGINKIGTLTTIMTSKFPYHCTPLVELGIVTINKNFYDKIIQS